MVGFCMPMRGLLGLFGRSDPSNRTMLICVESDRRFIPSCCTSSGLKPEHGLQRLPFAAICPGRNGLEARAQPLGVPARGWEAGGTPGTPLLGSCRPPHLHVRPRRGGRTRDVSGNGDGSLAPATYRAVCTGQTGRIPGGPSAVGGPRLVGKKSTQPPLANAPKRVILQVTAAAGAVEAGLIVREYARFDV